MTLLLSIKRVFKFPDNAWINEAIQAIGEGIKGIGTNLPMVKKTKTLSVSNRRAHLPQDFLDIVGISIGNSVIPISGNLTEDGCADLGEGYSLNPGYVICPLTKGEIKLHYVAIPVDDAGLPLIMNQQDYIYAIRWKVISELILGGYEHKIITWREADERWELYAGRAANASKMPSRDEMIRFGNGWTRLFGNIVYDFDIAGRLYTSTNKIS